MSSDFNNKTCDLLNLNDYMKSFTIICNSNQHIAYLADENDIIIAISNDFKKKFGIENNEQILNHTFETQSISSLNTYKTISAELSQQNKLIRDTRQKRIYMDIINGVTTSDLFIVHKTPIFDFESNFLCIHAQIRAFSFARLINIVMKTVGIKGFPICKEDFMHIELTRPQQMVLYLYVRNYSYKEVSIWLNRLGHNISAAMVNKTLDQLKTIFKVRDKEALRDISLKLGYDTALPAGFIRDGSYDITDDVFDLWVV
ncbi:MAG TPA: hypothetical protein PLP75_13300 [Burkholderiales bacterium]|nr:hypothetical protein [Burkholderiales bacterium]